MTERFVAAAPSPGHAYDALKPAVDWMAAQAPARDHAEVVVVVPQLNNIRATAQAFGAESKILRDTRRLDGAVAAHLSLDDAAQLAEWAQKLHDVGLYARAERPNRALLLEVGPVVDSSKATSARGPKRQGSERHFALVGVDLAAAEHLAAEQPRAQEPSVRTARSRSRRLTTRATRRPGPPSVSDSGR